MASYEVKKWSHYAFLTMGGSHFSHIRAYYSFWFLTRRPERFLDGDAHGRSFPASMTKLEKEKANA